ncbi:hypothetical protein [Aliamphritea ceti]|uniref:hypothetical protein n=1 Tax=Aliamphritea ceti TaxID=1524258 RepID=UPI0021C26C85|nr:hypothetical protein [Aliamphritea ceti]
MHNPQPNDIMGLLLNDDVSDDIAELEQLNNLIFCDADNTAEAATEISQGELIWREENDKFAIHVWKIDEKISLKFISKSKTEVSVQRLAKIALNAIMEDLKKANP